MNCKFTKIIYVTLLLLCNALFAQDTLLVPTESVLEKYRCFNPVEYRKAILITSITEANAKLKKCKSQLNPDTLSVDFTKNDIIFYYLNTGGGVLEFTYNLYKIPSEKRYLFVVKVKYDFVQPAVSTFRPIIQLSPKLDTTYTFDYKKIETTVPTPQSFIDRK